MRHSGFAISSPPATFRQARSTPVQLSMFDLMTSPDSSSAISSPASADGASPPASPDGPTTGPCGPDRARASRSRSPAKEPVSTIHGICGPTSFASSVPAGPLSSWESRLRERLAMVGSTELSLIWRQKVTPGGASISRLAPWTPPTSDRGSTGSPWPTPTAQPDNKTPEAHLAMKRRMGERDGTGANRTAITDLQVMAKALSTWPTPQASDGVGGKTPRPGVSLSGRASDGTKKSVGLSEVSIATATWPTPRTADGEKNVRTPEGSAREIARKGGPQDLAQATSISEWPTPTVAWADGGQTSRSGDRKCEMLIGGLVRGVNWPTPTANDWKGSGPTVIRKDGVDRTWQRLDFATEQGMAPSGPTTSGSPERTEKRGALNPAFSFYLMGFPPEWLAFAPSKFELPRR